MPGVCPGRCRLVGRLEPPTGYPAGRDAHGKPDQHGRHITHPEHHARAYTTGFCRAAAGVRRARELESGGAMSYFSGLEGILGRQAGTIVTGEADRLEYLTADDATTQP